MVDNKNQVAHSEEQGTLREYLYTIIFGTETPAGKWFDLVLICAILLSVAIVLLDSVQELSAYHHNLLFRLEWFFTIVFTIEYLLRIYISPKPWGYIKSFYGVIDLIAILPSYLALLYTNSSYLLVVRLLRVLRLFRILRLIRYMGDANILVRSMILSRRKIFIFFSFVFILSMLFGALIFIVEGPENGFTSIPRSVYWSVVTITTVGYGDIVPQTNLGQLLATFVMLTGYSIIAVPTGILTAEIAQEIQRQRTLKHCQNCHRSGHEADAEYCRHCGAELPE